MPSTHRFSILATLPDEGGLRRALAVERSGAARPVVLLFAASTPSDDAAALSALSRDAEAAARLHHPSIVPVAGLEPVGEALAVVELFRPGVSLRELLDAGGRLPPSIAVRIAIDACAGLAAVHALDPGDGRPFAHGALAPERILVQDDGRAAIAGLAAAAAAGAPPASESALAADLRALAAALHEGLAGEPPAPSAPPLAAPGVPPALAAVVDRALGRSALAPFASATELASALDAAVAPAAREAVAAYAEAVAPREEGTRGALARLVASALPPPIPPRDDTADVTAELLPPETPAPASAAAKAPAGNGPAPAVPRSIDVEPTPVAISASAPAPAKPPAAGPDSVATFPRPEPRPARSLAPIAAAAVFGTAGLVLGLLLARGTPTTTSTATETPTATATAAPTPTPPPAPAAAPAPAATATPVPASTRGAGERAGTAAAPKPRPASTRKSATAPKVAARPEGSGVLSVTAPLEAEVFLDGKRIGTGILRTEIPAGDHRVEVRLGGARVGERFSVARGETWTYVVNPE